jgi:hypothetical protein
MKFAISLSTAGLLVASAALAAAIAHKPGSESWTE